ncbi:Tn3 family transposase [Brevibacillus laterosporus]|uniref:Tn3 family transposase n=1 Tax=Brevibacillus laterosporus TaxID=1465 RepID=A0AAP3DLQ1_BRELA|nr:transposase [Brevibacillus laterosporus]MCR8983035.1 transposase [Brevibacillus laterosporus]MCZ0810191.1 Tn3 family transposase [Brevibacillus laterosporus]MCZ0828817.1 Tn3 family transposase [Brevibacillus laterosporus]MCZ0852829.1 Tn3 family transposase [Brevibacillus laterosporus]MED1667105.1 Tn3 family transposase [Brevibacillus laterosporus]
MLFFGVDGIFTENDPIEQEKRIKYNDLITNSVIFQNIVDITMILWQLKKRKLLLFTSRFRKVKSLYN